MAIHVCQEVQRCDVCDCDDACATFTTPERTVITICYDCLKLGLDKLEDALAGEEERHD